MLHQDSFMTINQHKPSGYFFNLEEEIYNKFVDKDYNALGRYNLNMGSKDKYGIERMKFFHSHGYKCLREMDGPLTIFLVDKSCDEVGDIKRKLRQQYNEGRRNKEFIWYDGKPIIWNPVCLNYVHTSDFSSETSMNYACISPE